MRYFVAFLTISGVWSGQPIRAQAFTAEAAYHKNGVLWFVAPSREGWLELAPEHLRSLPIPTADPTIVGQLAPAMDMYGNVETRTATPIPPGLASRYYYFAGVGGVQPFTTDSVQVVTRLVLTHSGTRIRGRRAWGEVFGGTDRLSGGGGFVLIAEETLSFEERPAEFTADELFLGDDVATTGEEAQYDGRGTAFWEIEDQYRFSIPDVEGEWLFIQWAADRENRESGCEFRFDLFRIEPGANVRRMTSNSYGCDV